MSPAEQDLRRKWELHEHGITQALGKALDYPWYKDDQKTFPGATEADGVCTFDDTSETLVDRACRALAEQKAEIQALRQEQENRFAYLYVYSDDVAPWLIVDPPENLNDLLHRWNALDDLYSDDLPTPEPWKPVNEWLAGKGVVVLKPKEIDLDDYR